PELVKSTDSAIKCGSAPFRAPAEGKAVAAGSIREEHILLAEIAKHPESSGEIAPAGVGLLWVSFWAEPSHRIIGVAVALDLTHGPALQNYRVDFSCFFPQISGLIAFFISSF